MRKNFPTYTGAPVHLKGYLLHQILVYPLLRVRSMSGLLTNFSLGDTFNACYLSYLSGYIPAPLS